MCTYLYVPDFFCQFVNHIIFCLGLSTCTQLVICVGKNGQIKYQTSDRFSFKMGLKFKADSMSKFHTYFINSTSISHSMQNCTYGLCMTLWNTVHTQCLSTKFVGKYMDTHRCTFAYTSHSDNVVDVRLTCKKTTALVARNQCNARVT